jgi:pyruvate-formate lyase
MNAPLPSHLVLQNPLATELAFTRVYRQHQHEPIALRELRCLEVLLPARFQSLQADDLLAGRVALPFCGLSPQGSGVNGAGGFTYYCNADAIKKIAAQSVGNDAWQAEVADMLAFWEHENTAAKTRAAYPDWVAQAAPTDDLDEIHVSYPLYRVAGTQLDYVKLVKLGIPGLRQQIQSAFFERADQDVALGQALIGSLDLLSAIAQRYADELRAAQAIQSEPLREEMIAALEAIQVRAPQTLREAVQLIWLFALASGTLNYGRLDNVLGSFLVNDLNAGRIDEEGAIDLLCSWWRLMDANLEIWNHRVTVGGRGRDRDGQVEADADQFALLAMEASRRVRLVTPQLTLRFYPEQNPALMEKALAVLGEGITFPMLYNDEVNIPAVMNAMAVPIEDAIDYLPYGCGEYIIWRKSVATPSGAVNVAKCLELVLNNGRCLMTNRLMGPETGAVESFTSFEALWDAYTVQLNHSIRALAQVQKIEYEIGAQQTPFLYLSMLMDDCIAQGKAILDGGVRYLGGTLESYGNVDVADALVAIRHVVFDDQTHTLPQLVEALRANWEGHESLRQTLLALPKYGNDNDEADALAIRVHDYLAETIRAQATEVGLHHYLMVVINNSMNVNLGKMTAALPDGRRAQEPLANGNNPVAGRDRNGVTAFLLSLAKLNPNRHAGAVQNMKFSKGMFSGTRDKLRALLNTYWASGGAQAMITVVSRGDLEAAIQEPEKWGHLIVRVGGFSARFVELAHDVQLHILARTLNE